MKCTFCGFTYDDEDVCPICGTPAPHDEPAVSELPAFEPGFASPAPIREQPNLPTPTPEQNRERDRSAPSGQPFKGLRIATLCVLSVMAAALVYLALLQTLAFAQNRRHDDKPTSSQQTTAAAPASTAPATTAPATTAPATTAPETTAPSTTAPSTTAPATTAAQASQPTGASSARQVGEAYDFGNGTVTLKSVTTEGSTAALKQMTLTVVLTNNTGKAQTYRNPDVTIGGSAFDAENFLRCKGDQPAQTAFSLKANESTAIVFYYRFPKEKMQLDCVVNAYTVGKNNESRIFTASYRIDTESVK